MNLFLHMKVHVKVHLDLKALFWWSSRSALLWVEKLKVIKLNFLNLQMNQQTDLHVNLYVKKKMSSKTKASHEPSPFHLKVHMKLHVNLFIHMKVQLKVYGKVHKGWTPICTRGSEPACTKMGEEPGFQRPLGRPDHGRRPGNSEIDERRILDIRAGCGRMRQKPSCSTTI